MSGMAHITEISVRSRERTEFIKLDGEIASFVSGSGVRNGVCHVFVPHTTAGVTINEGADPTPAPGPAERQRRVTSKVSVVGRACAARVGSRDQEALVPLAPEPADRLVLSSQDCPFEASQSGSMSPGIGRTKR